MVNLIFEGAHSTGKSSLIAEFMKYSRYKLFHFQKPPRNLNNVEKADFQRRHYYLMIDYLIHDDNIIFDRFHIGEQIYSPLFRGGYEPSYIEDLEEQIKKHCVLVCVFCSNVNLLKRFDNVGINRDLLAETNSKFKELCRKSKLKKIFIDTSIMPAKKCYFKIIKELKNGKNKQA